MSEDNTYSAFLGSCKKSPGGKAAYSISLRLVSSFYFVAFEVNYLKNTSKTSTFPAKEVLFVFVRLLNPHLSGVIFTTYADDLK